ncbi:MAG: sigma-54 dependent transcriptional regulator [Desulfobulbus sp.]|nr:sigma-54 dependent transcriptional regulator [Desulfobulbus sp.]
MSEDTFALPEILVVDDDLYLLAAIKQTLVLNGYAVQTFGNPMEALNGLGGHSFAAVLADIRMPEMDGMELLERILEKDPDLPVILITGHGDISMAVEAVKKGAYNFLQKPVDEDIIIATLSRAIERRQLVLENRRLEQQLIATREGRSRFFGLVGSHPAMLGLYTLIEAVAGETDPVLIIGETGTGKELVARAIHDIGKRSTAPYVAVNMGALPSEMIESELFGHEKGAFTGAIQRKVGKFEYAGEGTLFLDEICSMPSQLQSKLLRVLEDRTFSRLGSNGVIPLKARVIAATNRDLLAEIDKGTFRQDLYFRLNVLPVYLPPLRERKEDIPLLVDYFWNEYCGGQAGSTRPCTPELIRQLMQREWPGNIRELRNFVRRFCVLGEPEPLVVKPVGAADVLEMDCLPWKEFMDQQERSYVEQVLRKVGGQVSAAHQMMGISRKSLYDKINKYGLDLSRFRQEGAKS